MLLKTKDMKTAGEILKYNRRCVDFLEYKYKSYTKFWDIYPLDSVIVSDTTYIYDFESKKE